MNWKAIRKAWESGDLQVAVRLLESMLFEMRFRQAGLGGFLSLGSAPSAGAGPELLHGPAKSDFG